jgi:hypothetical protein
MNLGPTNFTLEKDVLRLNLGSQGAGAILIYFRSPTCPVCINTFDKVWTQVQQIDKRVKYGIVDVKSSAELVRKSLATKAPITATPKLIMYLNQFPKAAFIGLKTVDGVCGFIEDFLNTINTPKKPDQQRQQFVQPIGMSNAFGNTGLRTNNNTARVDTLEDNDVRLITPDNITPKNTPWKLDEHFKGY